MAECGVSPHGVAACGAQPGDGISEADFDAALLREQYRSLARLGPYVHGVVILAALALFGATGPTRSLFFGILLPAVLIAVSLLRLISWFRARAGVELEPLELVRRKVRAAGVFGPMLTLAFVLMTAIATWREGVVEFALALSAVWGVAAACAICLNTLPSEARLIIVAATAPLVLAFLARGAELTLCLAALIAIAAGFVIRMLDEHFRMFAEIVRSRFVVAEQQRAAEKARQAAMTIALTDDLTGLPNRRCFQSLLDDRIRTATETGQPFALGLIDLDGFKPINDVHGHPVGDEILRQVANRLATAMDGRGSAARIGGDEFALLCDGIGARGEAIALGEEIRTIFATPFAVQPLAIRLTCACGFALFPSSAAEPGELVRLADAALYRAKSIGRGGAAVFDARAGGGAPLHEALRRTVAESEIDVPLRPIVGMTAGRISSLESVARSNAAALGPVAPALVPFPERIGVIGQRSRDSLRKAAPIGANSRTTSLSFNLTAAQLRRPR
jgi:diguanylate cyclase (GGDEF)-like protein